MKDNYRDYTADAFRFYSLCGKPSENLIRQLRTKLPAKYQGSIDDLAGVAKMLNCIRIVEPDDADMWIKVVDLVYFSNPKRPAPKGAISERVRYAVLEAGISEATAYRILRKAREIYARERGLRRGESDSLEIRKVLDQMKYGGN